MRYSYLSLEWDPCNFPPFRELLVICDEIVFASRLCDLRWWITWAPTSDTHFWWLWIIDLCWTFGLPLFIGFNEWLSLSLCPRELFVSLICRILKVAITMVYISTYMYFTFYCFLTYLCRGALSLWPLIRCDPNSALELLDEFDALSTSKGRLWSSWLGHEPDLKENV